MRRVARAAFIAALLAALPAAAQPALGDYLLVDPTTAAAPRLLVVDPTGRTRLLAAPGPSHLVVEPRMDVGNRDVVAVFHQKQSGSGSLVRIDPNGAVTSIVAQGVPFPRAIESAADGSYLLLDSLDSIHRAASNAIARIATVPPPFGGFSMTIDPVTGDYWLLGFGGTVAQVDHRTRAVTTLTPTPFRFGTGIDHDEATDSFVVITETLQTVLRSDRQLRVVSSFRTAGQAMSVRLFPETGHVHVLQLNSTVSEYTLAGVVIRTTPIPRVDPFSLDVYGSRPLAGRGTGARGTVYRLSLGFPGGAGLPYAIALSLGGIGPGIRLPDGRTIALALDGLFTWTAGRGDIPGLTQGLRGNLSPTGQAVATIAIPGWLPARQRIFAAAIAFDRNAPSGIRLGNTWAFEVF